ncbi:MAG TPA: CdaR family protein [Terriglobales bacterium]|nr:CdaR family protein [Terriglobales bacterium]
MSDFVHRYITNNLALKLVSLGLAVGLWLAVARDPVDEIALEIPIEFHNVPKDLEISTESIPRAQIRLGGPERLVHRLQPSDIHMEIDLSHVTGPGQRTFDLAAQRIEKPHDLQVVQIVPTQVQLTFDRRMTRQVEVHPRVIGSFAGGRQIAKVEVNPSVIQISGPQQRVQAVEAAITDPVDVSGTMERNTFVTHAYVSDPMVQVVNPRPIYVTVIVQKSADAESNH